MVCYERSIYDLTLPAIDGKVFYWHEEMIASRKDKENNNSIPAHLGASYPQRYLDNQPKQGRTLQKGTKTRWLIYYRDIEREYQYVFINIIAIINR